ncbi:mitochondrial resolvase Ydc2 [Xylaria nigripes]|nr:mitochondrial resolvase Ydc2 [Xylaria nigripes]
MSAVSRSVPVVPRALLAKHLRRLSARCGLVVTGTKDELIMRLNDAAKLSPTPPSKWTSKPVILSIDLGIKNLAYSLMTIAPKTYDEPKANKKKSTGKTKLPVSPATSPLAIQLHAWQRLSVIESHGSASTENGESEVDIKSSIVFAPAALAETTNNFLRKMVLQLDPLPNYILIERQRWRTNGAAAIQEWTLRVNTLEAMLHASLRTMRDFGVWNGEVISVRSERVGALFIEEDEADAKKVAKKVTKKTVLEEEETDEASAEKPTRKRKSSAKKSADIKRLKIQLLTRWLHEDGRIIQPASTEVSKMIDGYLHALKDSRLKKPKVEVDEEQKFPDLGKKLDDFTDCILQGMAWLRWQENLALLQTPYGVEKVLEEG